MFAAPRTSLTPCVPRSSSSASEVLVREHHETCGKQFDVPPASAYYAFTPLRSGLPLELPTMSSHGPRTRIVLSPLLKGALTVLGSLACTTGAANAEAVSEAAACGKEVAAATSITDGVPAAIRARVNRRVREVSALSRFDRQDDALAKLDALIAVLEGPRGVRVEDGARPQLTKSIQALRRCVATTHPAPLTWITIAVFDEANTPEGGRGEPAGEGVFIHADDISIGRTGRDGTLEARLPAGTIEINATKYPSSWGAESVTLAAGETRVVSIVMAGDKEPGEESDLVLEEAPDDILPANPGSVTLKIVRDDAPVTLEDIDSIELCDIDGNLLQNLKPFFSVSDNAMRASDVAAVARLIAQHSRDGRAVSIWASGMDREGRRHYGDVRFQTGRHTLTVTLAAPPSTPALAVSDIRVRISVGGGDVVMSRVSDANGRFEIESLPDTVIDIKAERVGPALYYYYADATVTLCGDTSATVLLRNVKDIVAGVRPVTVDPGPSACLPTPRR
jgi:hypothetical protein